MTFFTFYFFFSFFLGSTAFHSPPCCSLGSDGNWVALVVRAEATESCLAHTSRLCRLPLRRSSMESLWWRVPAPRPSFPGQWDARCCSIRFSEDTPTRRLRRRTENTSGTHSPAFSEALSAGPRFPPRATTDSLLRVLEPGYRRRVQSSWTTPSSRRQERLPPP